MNMTKIPTASGFVHALCCLKKIKLMKATVPYARAVCLLMGLLLLSAANLRAQNYGTHWSTIAGGTVCLNAKFSMSGIIGLPDAGVGRSGGFIEQGGFVPGFIKTVGPTLRLTPSMGGYVLSWPSDCTGFHVGWTSALPAASWNDLGEGTLVGAERRVLIFAGAGNVFFRLRKDCLLGCPDTCPQ
jgi:hypothetical protein